MAAGDIVVKMIISENGIMKTMARGEKHGASHRGKIMAVASNDVYLHISGSYKRRSSGGAENNRQASA